MSAERIIQLLDLQPLPVEGGYFRETWRAEEVIPGAALPPCYSGPRPCGTAIYFLLTADADCFSALHRLSSDEVYHFYLGDPVEILLLEGKGSAKRVLLGPAITEGQAVQFVVPRNTWQGSRLVPGGRFALLGTTMSPGFDPRDFTLGDRQQLLRDYPGEFALITALTR